LSQVGRIARVRASQLSGTEGGSHGEAMNMGDILMMIRVVIVCTLIFDKAWWWRTLRQGFRGATWSCSSLINL
jgi:hypothetical protein